MEKRKVRMVEGFKKRIEKICKFFSDHDNAIRIEVEVPVSNEELASEIKRSVDNLRRLIDEAEKRNLKVIFKNGIFECFFPIKTAKLKIIEIKQY
jgi:hypothetical protein